MAAAEAREQDGGAVAGPDIKGRDRGSRGVSPKVDFLLDLALASLINMKAIIIRLSVIL